MSEQLMSQDQDEQQEFFGREEYLVTWQELYERKLAQGVERNAASYSASQELMRIENEALGRQPIGSGDYEAYY